MSRVEDWLEKVIIKSREISLNMIEIIYVRYDKIVNYWVCLFIREEGNILR